MDPDSGAGGEITYTITDATPRDSISRFNINGRTGAITLTQSLDRESTSLITLRVMARDQGVPCELALCNSEYTIVEDYVSVFGKAPISMH